MHWTRRQAGHGGGTAGRRRAPLAAGFAAGVTLLAAACAPRPAPGAAGGQGSGAASGSPIPPPAASPSPGGRARTPQSAPQACTPAAVRVRLDASAAGAAAGTEYLPLDFTNVTGARCRLAGFPAVSATSSTGHRVGAAAALDRSLAARPLVLGAGQTAHAWLRLADVANLPAALCRPVTAAGLRVLLPGQSGEIFVAHRLLTCARAVPGDDILMIEPFRLGIARRGTAQ